MAFLCIVENIIQHTLLLRKLWYHRSNARCLRLVSHPQLPAHDNPLLTAPTLFSSLSLTNPLLLIALGFLVGGFAAINKWAPDPVQFGDHTVTQKHLYIGLFVIGIPLLWISSPISTLFWIVGASGILILGHASLMEPGIESEYASVQDSV